MYKKVAYREVFVSYVYNYVFDIIMQVLEMDSRLRTNDEAGTVLSQ